MSNSYFCLVFPPANIIIIFMFTSVCKRLDPHSVAFYDHENNFEYKYFDLWWILWYYAAEISSENVIKLKKRCITRKLFVLVILIVLRRNILCKNFIIKQFYI